jgi:formylglycine-generating enzyme required for sulfatase activity
VRRRPTFPLALILGLVTLAWLSAYSSASELPGEVLRDCAQCGELVVVPPGDFMMGSDVKPSESPPHKVTIGKAFAIGRKAVTFAEWDRCVAAAGCKYTAPDYGWGRGERPVIDLSWDDAKEFIGWLSRSTGKPYRLPTEAEWEYAARAGTATPYWWGKTADSGRARCADCGGDDAKQTAPAGSFRPNSFGLYDTAGNSSEWVEDCWNPNYRGAPADGSAWATGDCSLRVLRGGSYLDKAASIRSAARFRYDESVRYNANGLRVARDVQ